MMMEAARTSETSVNFYQATRHNNPENSHLHRLKVFKNMVLRRIFGPKRQEIIQIWRQLHDVELQNLYSSPHIIRVIKAMGMIWVMHVVRRGR
jgi:hypothetical protein